MKTYLQMDGDQLVEYVEKREYDEAKSELSKLYDLLKVANQTSASMDMKAIKMEVQLDSAKDYNVKLLTAFNHLSTRLMNIAFDPAEPMHFAENVANHVDDLREDFNAHQDAVNRMEVVNWESWTDVPSTHAALEGLRGELIQAAKGERHE